MAALAGEVVTIAEVGNASYGPDVRAASWCWKLKFLEKIDLTLRKGARIRITNPWMAQGYRLGDELTVQEVIEKTGGVWVFNSFGRKEYVSASEFVIIG